jgi:hypothetical protein
MANIAEDTALVGVCASKAKANKTEVGRNANIGISAT